MKRYKWLVFTLAVSVACWQSKAFAETHSKKFDLAKAPQTLDEVGDPGLYKVTISNLAPANASKYKFRIDRETLEYSDLPKPDSVTVPFDKKAGPIPAPANAAGRIDCTGLEAAVDALLIETDETKIPNLIAKSIPIAGCGEQNTRAAAAINLTKVEANLVLKSGTKAILNIVRDDKTWSYSIKSDIPGKFVANWGIAVLPNNDEDYFSSSNGEGAFVITEKTTDGVTIIPSVFYTYVPNFDPDSEVVHGWSLGLGLDQDNLSAFAGYNWTYRTKLGFTFGVAAHKQERLLGEFREGQLLTESIETLTEDAYQLNIFGALVYGF